MPDVLLAYSIAALLVAVVFVLAFVLGRALGGSGRLLNLIGLVIVAIALLEKAGWSVRPWTAGSPAAAFNDLLFRILFLVGFGLLFVSWAAALKSRS